MISRPSQNTKWAGSVGKTNVTGTGFSADVPSVFTMIPPSTKPMNRMNRPMPTPIARFSDSGTALMIASRRPTRTRIVTTMPSSTMTPIAPAGDEARVEDEPERDDAVDPEAGGQGDRDVRDDAHRDRHDARRRAPSRRMPPAPEMPGGGQDARVHEEDVGHDHERGHAGLDLRRESRPAFGELEVRRDRFHADQTLHSGARRSRTRARSAPCRRAVAARAAGLPLPPEPWPATRRPRTRYSTSRASRPCSSIWTKPLVSNSSCCAAWRASSSAAVIGAYSMMTRSSPWTRV